jgi:hypothetical protein
MFMFTMHSLVAAMGDSSSFADDGNVLGMQVEHTVR